MATASPIRSESMLKSAREQKRVRTASVNGKCIILCQSTDKAGTESVRKGLYFLPPYASQSPVGRNSAQRKLQMDANKSRQKKREGRGGGEGREKREKGERRERERRALLGATIETNTCYTGHR